MINNTGPVNSVPDIQLDEINEVAGSANVSPSYLVSEVQSAQDITPISGDSAAISASSSSGASIGSSQTTATYTSPAINHRESLSNYILNLSMDELQTVFSNRVVDGFVYGGTVLRNVLPENIDINSNFDVQDLISRFNEQSQSSSTEKITNIDSYVDPYDSSIYDLVKTMNDYGIITEGMSSDEIASAVYNYIIDNFDYISDGVIDNWSTVSLTIKRGGGDCEDLSFLLASSIMAALIDSGMSYAEANQRVQGMAVNLDSGNDHILVTYTADDGTVRILDPSSSQGNISGISEAAEASSSKSSILFTFNDSTVGIVDQSYDYSNFAPSFNFYTDPISNDPEIDISKVDFNNAESVRAFLDQLKSLGILFSGMTLAQIGTAIFYVLSDVLNINSNDFCMAAYNLINAALISNGANAEKAKDLAAEILLGSVIQLLSGNPAELGRILGILHPQTVDDPQNNMFNIIFGNNSLKGFVVARAFAEILIKAGIITEDFSFTYVNPKSYRGQKLTFSIEFYANGSYRIYTGNYNTDYNNIPADYLDYIFEIHYNLPPGGDIYDLAAAIDLEFESILDAYDEKDFWRFGKHGFKIPREDRINALFNKMQKLTNLYIVIAMLHKGKQTLRNVVQEEMEGIKGYKGLDTSKMVGKSCQNAMLIIMRLTQTLLEEIMDYNEALYQELLEEAEDANDSCWEQFEDAITFGENTRKVLEAQMEATKAFMDATKSSLKALENLQMFEVAGQDEGSDDPTVLDDAMNRLEQEIDERLDELLGRITKGIRNGDNNYLWADNDFLMGLREGVVGLMNTMRCYLMVTTSRQDLRNVVHEEMTGVSGRTTEKENIMQSYENKFAQIMMNFDRMVSMVNQYVQLYNQYQYLEKQWEKAGGGFFEALSNFDLPGMIYHLPGFLNCLGRFNSTLFGWIPIIGPIINFEAALATGWADAYYNDEMNIPKSNYNPTDTRTNTGDQFYDLMNNLNYQIGNTLSSVNSNLLLTVDDGMYQMDYAGAAMYVDMLTGLQNMQRVVLAASRNQQEKRDLVHMEMTGVGSRQSSQLVDTANSATMSNQMAQFSANMANLLARKTAHNLEQAQDNAIDKMFDQAMNNLWNIIPGIGSIFSHFANLNSAQNDPALGMDLNSPNISYFTDKAEEAQGLSYEQQIEAMAEDLYQNLLINGLVYAGGVSSMGIDAAMETQIKQQFRGLANVMYILSSLNKHKLESRDLVHKEMTGVKSSVPGQMSEQVMNADFQKMMKIIDYLIKWMEEVMEVDDRADEAEATLDRLQSYTALTIFMAVLETVLMCIPGVGPIAAAIIEIAKGIINHIATLIIEFDLMSDVKAGGYGDLENMSTIDFSNDSVNEMMSDAEESIYSGINSDLIATLDGGSSYVNHGAQVDANYQISRIYNIRRLVATLVKSLQDLRNEVHVYMTGVGGKTSDTATGAYNRSEQVSKSIVDGLFRRLDRMAWRDNQIHQAEITYNTAVIQSWINLAMSGVKAFLKVSSGRLSDKIDAVNEKIDAAKKDKGAVSASKDEIAEIEKLTKRMNAAEYAYKVLSLTTPMISAAFELIRELKEYSNDKVNNSPYEIESEDKSGRADGKGKKGDKASSGKTWMEQLDQMEMNSVKSQIASANTAMSLAQSRARLQMWKNLIEAIKKNMTKILANGFTGFKEMAHANNKAETFTAYRNASLDNTLEKFMVLNPGKMADLNSRGWDETNNLMNESPSYKAVKWVTDLSNTLMSKHDINFQRLMDEVDGWVTAGLTADDAIALTQANLNNVTATRHELEARSVQAQNELKALDKTPENKQKIEELEKEIAEIEDLVEEYKAVEARYQTAIQQLQSAEQPSNSQSTAQAPVLTTPDLAHVQQGKVNQALNMTKLIINGKEISEASDIELVETIVTLRTQRKGIFEEIANLRQQLKNPNLKPEEAKAINEKIAALQNEIQEINRFISQVDREISKRNALREEKITVPQLENDEAPDNINLGKAAFEVLGSIFGLFRGKKGNKDADAARTSRPDTYSVENNESAANNIKQAGITLNGKLVSEMKEQEILDYYNSLIEKNDPDEIRGFYSAISSLPKKKKDKILQLIVQEEQARIKGLNNKAEDILNENSSDPKETESPEPAAEVGQNSVPSDVDTTVTDTNIPDQKPQKDEGSGSLKVAANILNSVGDDYI